MRKTLLALFVIGFTLPAQAQGDNQEWQFGVNFMPFLFWRKNNYLDHHPHIIVMPPQGINGVSGGIVAEKYFNANWGIKVGFNYSNQKTIVRSTVVPKDNNGNFILDDPNLYPSLKSKNSFDYFLIPISVEFAKPLNENFFWIVGGGPQFSIFSNFRVQRYGTHPDGSNENPTGLPVITDVDAYRKILVGVTAFTGIKFRLSDAFNGFVNVNYQYDFSNASKGNINSFSTNPNEYGQLELTDPTLPYSSVNASKSHNMRLGLEFGIVYDLRL